MNNQLNRTIHILYIEDSQDDVDLLSLVLNRSEIDFEMTSVNNLESAEKLLKQEKYDLVISDFDLHTFSGEDVIKLVREVDLFLPIVIISGTVGEEKAVNLIKQGASDFFLKHNIRQIPKEVIKILDTAEAKQNSVHYQEQIAKQATILDTIFASHDDFIFLKNADRRYVKVNKAMVDHFQIGESSFINHTDEELDVKHSLDDTISSDMEVLLKGRTVLLETDYINEKNERVVLETVKSPILEHGIVTGIVGISRNITEKKTYEEELNKNQQILHRAEQITQSASFHYDPGSDLITVSRNFNRLMGTSGASYQLSLQKFSKMVYEADLPLFLQELDHAIKNKKQFEMELRYHTKNELKFGKVIIFPDLYQKSPFFYGTIVDITTSRQNFLALNTIQEQERKRISRELHDNIGQKLTAAKMFVNQMRINHDTCEVTEKLETLVHQSIREIRSVSRELSIKLVEENGLSDALIQLVNFVPDPLQIELSLEMNDQEISDHVGGNIFRIVQEALSNTMKYADASCFSISLQQCDDYLILELNDNGRGFEVNKAQSSGNGLKNIEQRAKSCNGIMKINSGKDLGTSITIKLPPN